MDTLYLKDHNEIRNLVNKINYNKLKSEQ